MQEIKLYAMTCGWITMPAGFFLAGQTGNLAVPVPCYFIEHPKVTILFDTGLETALQSDNPDIVQEALGIFAKITTVQYQPGEDVTSRLKNLGLILKKLILSLTLTFILIIAVGMLQPLMHDGLSKKENGKPHKKTKI